VVFCAIFGTIFLLVYNPLNVANASVNYFFGYQVPIKFAAVIGGVALIITQFILRPLLGFKNMKVYHFFLWITFELILLSILFYIFFGDKNLDPLSEYFVVLVDTVMLTLIPYGLAVLSISFYKSETINTTTNLSLSGHITFRDEGGKLIMTIPAEDLVYLKADDNYVAVYHLMEGEVQNVLVRISLKKLLTEMANPELVRVHRSYAINLNNLNSVKKNRGKVEIRMKYDRDISIPVSNTYEKGLRSFIPA
jgi:tRNA threonylcarbamoyladenosine modification (KEOPS) complex  Pcc1 subunit